MNRVKIVATIGPRTNSREIVLALRDAGMSMARLNGSHGDLEWHSQTIDLLREVVPDLPLLLDIPGTKIRTGAMERDLVVSAGEQVVLSGEPGHNGGFKVSVTYPDLHRNLHLGDTILADEGSLKFKIVGIQDRDVVCIAETGGVLGSAKGIHVPGLAIQRDKISDKDRHLLDLACKKGVDFVGASFVESAKHVEGIRSLLGERGPRIVSKIETQGGLDHLDEVLRVSDAIMIDRGDLSMDTAPSMVALLQKRILTQATAVACPVIVATEMLHSMIDNPLPTKAEVSDITNAVLDGATALMLSGETAVGSYPTESVELMRQVADASTAHLDNSINGSDIPTSESIPQAMGDAIALLCRRLEITKIVAVTVLGFAARTVAAAKPSQLILAVSNDAAAARSFNLFRSTKGIYVGVPFARTNMDHIPLCLEELWRRGELVEEDQILVTAVGYPSSGNRMNLIETHLISDLRASLGWT